MFPVSVLLALGHCGDCSWSLLWELGEVPKKKKPVRVYASHAYVQSRFSLVPLSETLWIVVCQAPLSMGFSRQEYWSGLPCPPPSSWPRDQTHMSCTSCIGRWVLYSRVPPGKPLCLPQDCNSHEFVILMLIHTQPPVISQKYCLCSFNFSHQQFWCQVSRAWLL